MPEPPASESRNLAAMYIEILDGLRSHYARRLTTKGSAGYQAAMSLSFLFGICTAALLIIIDASFTGGLHVAMWFYDHILLVVAFGILTAWAHVQYAKYWDVYNKIGPPISSSWRSWFVAYCIIASVLSLLALLTAYLVRPHEQ